MDERLRVVEQVVTCTRCELAAQCTAPVPLRGPKARVAVIGEAPGETEDSEGMPFVGPAGRLLADVFAEVGLTEPVAFLNTVSCFPHGTPTWDHVDACDANKRAQIDWVEPTYLLLLGKVALKGVRRVLTLKARGIPFLFRGIVCYATYHPAAALRNYNYEEAMRADLETFVAMTSSGDWERFVPAHCAACMDYPQWWEADSTLGWCPKHIPESEQAAYERNQQRIHAVPSASTAWRTVMAEERRAVGLARVEAATDPAWNDRAWTALVRYLIEHDEFFVDDFWSDSGLDEPCEARALGPLVLRAAREGLMEQKGEFRKSVASNLSPKPVWQSLVHGEVGT